MRPCQRRCDRPRRSSTPTTIATVENNPSLTCRAAELIPWSPFGDSSRVTTEMEAIAMPMPKPPIIQPAAPTRTGTDASSAGIRQAIAMATRTQPICTSCQRGRSRVGRPWKNEPAAQPSAPPVSANPAIVVDNPRSLISDNGKNVSAPKKAAAREPAHDHRRRQSSGEPGSTGRQQARNADRQERQRHDQQQNRRPVEAGAGVLQGRDPDGRTQGGPLPPRRSRLAVAALEPSQPRRHQGHRRKHEDGYGQEHPAPGQMVGERAGDRGADE